MKRWSLRSLVCLILGAITTVAVAWGIAYGTSIDDLDADDLEEWKVTVDQSVWIMRGGRTHGTSTVAGIPDVASVSPSWLERVHQRNQFPSWSRMSERRDARVTATRWPLFIDVARGWPALALANGIDADFFGDYIENAVYVDGVHLGRMADSSEFGDRVLPLRPIWPGFLIDTLFYAAIWFGVFFGFSSAKRFLRTKRGRCPRCGYDLRGQLAAGCPECGWGRTDQAE